MPYTTNKNMPRIRREAVEFVRRGWSARKVGRYLGFHHTAIIKWVTITKKLGYGLIPTQSSRPHSHPKQLKEEIVRKIVEKRLKHNRYAEAVHRELLNDGVKVSLSSVKRTLERKYLIKKRSPWKRYHPHQDRPYALQSGDLVQIDTIHRMVDEKKRVYVFVLLDVYSRWTYAKAFERMNAKTSIDFVLEAQKEACFHFNMLQSDHGPEFGKWFVERIEKSHRYTRIGKPNDNAHIERFNRTVQEECLDTVQNNVKKINCALKKYLRYYNYERVHAGINYLIPMQVV
ncbi:MAG: DDE-type integrase/transposase/recombinase [Parcubacteria group bacterium]|nr:DDE-type integrase/transposase/recombinase [Parcubacteria group bacterium]